MPTLTAATREAVQIAVLQSLNAVHPFGLIAQDLLTPVKLGTGLHGLTLPELSSLLDDMQSQGVVSSAAKPLNKAVLVWKRTPDGLAHLESLNLLP